MIAQISGKVVKRGKNSLLIDVSGICYEVLIPTAIMHRIENNLSVSSPASEISSGGGAITLITYHYHNLEPSRAVPILIGFLNEVERDFFQAFITVSGVGPRAALKALAQPLSAIVRAIDEGDVAYLKSLPGIGQQRAREIVAKLQGKVGKFGLIQDAQAKEPADNCQDDIEAEAIEVLVQLQYKRQEAKEMVRRAKERCSRIATTEELLNEVYKQKLKK